MSSRSSGRQSVFARAAAKRTTATGGTRPVGSTYQASQTQTQQGYASKAQLIQSGALKTPTQLTQQYGTTTKRYSDQPSIKVIQPTTGDLYSVKPTVTDYKGNVIQQGEPARLIKGGYTKPTQQAMWYSQQTGRTYQGYRKSDKDVQVGSVDAKLLQQYSQYNQMQSVTKRVVQQRPSSGYTAVEGYKQSTDTSLIKKQPVYIQPKKTLAENLGIYDVSAEKAPAWIKEGSYVQGKGIVGAGGEIIPRGSPEYDKYLSAESRRKTQIPTTLVVTKNGEEKIYGPKFTTTIKTKTTSIPSSEKTFNLKRFEEEIAKYRDIKKLKEQYPQLDKTQLLQIEKQFAVRKSQNVAANIAIGGTLGFVFTGFNPIGAVIGAGSSIVGSGAEEYTYEKVEFVGSEEPFFKFNLPVLGNVEMSKREALSFGVGLGVSSISFYGGMKGLSKIAERGAVTTIKAQSATQITGLTEKETFGKTAVSGKYEVDTILGKKSGVFTADEIFGTRGETTYSFGEISYGKNINKYVRGEVSTEIIKPIDIANEPLFKTTQILKVTKKGVESQISTINPDFMKDATTYSQRGVSITGIKAKLSDYSGFSIGKNKFIYSERELSTGKTSDYYFGYRKGIFETKGKGISRISTAQSIEIPTSAYEVPSTEKIVYGKPSTFLNLKPSPIYVEERMAEVSSSQLGLITKVGEETTRQSVKEITHKATSVSFMPIISSTKGYTRSALTNDNVRLTKQITGYKQTQDLSMKQYNKGFITAPISKQNQILITPTISQKKQITPIIQTSQAPKYTQNIKQYIKPTQAITQANINAVTTSQLSGTSTGQNAALGLGIIPASTPKLGFPKLPFGFPSEGGGTGMRRRPPAYGYKPLTHPFITFSLTDVIGKSKKKKHKRKKK